MRVSRALAVLLAGSVLALAGANAAARDVDVRHEAYDATARPPVADPAVVALFEPATFVGSEGVRLPYRLMAPASVAPGRRYPLVVLLHGSGAIGQDNEQQLGAVARAWGEPALRRRFPAYVLAPQVPVRSADYRPDRDGLPASMPGASLPAVLALIDQVGQRADVDPDRIYLVGFSMGASAALAALVERPRQFAAVVGFAPVPPARELAASVSPVPMLLVHGSADEENPFAADEAWVRAVTAAGGRPRFIVIDGMAHEFPQQMLSRRDWRTWLFGRRRAGSR
ncbi:carboxylesterase family protein [Agrilutibacter solisilvae]|uniref:Alpha/beta fold hydrolase n=1 Tax=Agrilutibacter solisilvae TaxID=2763317 RepID=A0A975ATY0_9GAMM|nr:alpha/beta fold hydrolase [Lysobacter solisilvae]QSX79629.1 alpha/beta fold hydrolase [Lysobacter solisilvae]